MTAGTEEATPVIMNQASAKADVLASIKRNLSASCLLNAIYSEDVLHATVDRSDAAAEDLRHREKSLVDTFCENLTLVGGRFIVVRRMGDVIGALKSILDELDPRRIAVSDSAIVRSAAVAAAANAVIHEDPTAVKLFACDVGITEAQWALAETGTLVLESDKETNRLTSLVPDVHICILQAENIRSAMGEVLAMLDVAANPVVTFITGPSRTSDIELTLAIGVHGPRDLFVIVVADCS